MSYPEAWLRSLPPEMAQALRNVGAAPITWTEREAKARLEADEYLRRREAQKALTDLQREARRLREAEKAATLAYLRRQQQNTQEIRMRRPAPKPALPPILEIDQPRRFEFEG